MDPHHHGQPAGGRIGGAPDVQEQAVFRRSRSARARLAAGGGPNRPCMQFAPNSAAWRTPVHRAAGCGGRHRKSPTEARRRGCPCTRRLRRRPRLAGRRYPPSRLQALAHAPWCQHSSRLPARPASTREAWSPSKPPWLCRSVLRAYGIVQAVSTRRCPSLRLNRRETDIRREIGKTVEATAVAADRYRPAPAGASPSARRRAVSLVGALPKKRPYSRVNCDGLR